MGVRGTLCHDFWEVRVPKDKTIGRERDALS